MGMVLVVGLGWGWGAAAGSAGSVARCAAATLHTDAACKKGGVIFGDLRCAIHHLAALPSHPRPLLIPTPYPTACACRLGVKASPLHDFYPPHMTAAFVAALARFDRQLPGFARWAWACASCAAMAHAV